MHIDTNTTREAIREAIRATKANHEMVAEIYKSRADRETPAQTIARAVERMGLAPVVVTVAEMVNSIGYWDERIYPGVREWAQEVPGAMGHEECRERHIYTDIHSCHVNQLAQACMKL